MTQRQALEIFLDSRNLDQAVVSNAPVRQHALQRRESRQAYLLRVLTGISGQKCRNQDIRRIPVDTVHITCSRIIRHSSQAFIMDKAHIRIFQAGILAFDTLGNDLAVCQQLVKSFRRIVIHSIATASECASQRDCRHGKVSPHNLRHTFIHKLYFRITRIVAKSRQVDLQSSDRFEVRPYIQIFRTGHDCGIHVSLGIRNQPAFFICLVYIATTHVTERKTDPRGKSE